MNYIALIVLFGITIGLMGSSCPQNPPGNPSPTPQPSPSPTTLVRQALRIHPVNKHYFQDVTTGEPVLIAAYENLVPTDRTFDDIVQVASMKARGFYYARIWHWLPWSGASAVWPWLKLPNGKFDFDQWDPEYWQRMHKSLDAATKAGITSEILVFERCGMSPPDETRWFANPWAKENNVNNLETPTKTDDGTPEFYQMSSRPRMHAYQKAYVKKLVQELAKYNVIFEIENEHWQYDKKDWPEFWANFINAELRNLGISRLVSYNSLEDDMEDAFDIPGISIVNPHFGGNAEKDTDILNQYLEPRWSKNKAMNVDEFANGLEDPNVLRRMLFTIIMSGGNFHIEDAAPESKPTENTQSVINFIKLTGWNYIESHPQKNYSSGGYCMIAEGKSYACYYPNNVTSKSIDLPQGRWQYDFFDTHNRGIHTRATFDHPGGVKNFQFPFSIDWVLHVKRI